MPAESRDGAIDTMRGIAILMVIGIHSLPQPLDAPWATALDAALRPCVPVFLFASGYLTALSGRVPLAKRLKAALIPYAIAFAAAYVYMALHNPAMDHRIIAALARFAARIRLRLLLCLRLCRLHRSCMWLDLCDRGSRYAGFSKARTCALSDPRDRLRHDCRRYLDPALSRLGASDALLDEVRMRDIPFWFSFMSRRRADRNVCADLGDHGMRRALLSAPC